MMFLMVLFFNKPSIFVFSIPLQAVCFLLGEGLMILTLFMFRAKLTKSRYFGRIVKNDQKLVLLGLIILFFVQVLFVSQFYSQTGFDADYIYHAAQQMPHSDFGPEYFSLYPNNLLLLFLEYFVYQINIFFGLNVDFYWLLVVLNIIAIDIALYLIYVITKKIFSQLLACCALALGILLLGLMPWLTSVYSDTLSIPIALSIFYLYLRLKDTSHWGYKLGYGILIGVFLELGFLMKPATIFIGIAIILIEIMMCNYRLLIQNSQKIILSSLIGGAVLFGVYAVRLPFNYVLDNQQIIEYDAAMNFPFTHWMMMGLKESKIGDQPAYGFWTVEDFSLTYNIQGKDEKTKANIAVIKTRLKDHGFFGYLQFVWNKSIWFLGDGTFFWNGEGVSRKPTELPGMQKTIQEFIYPSGRYYHYYAYMLQTVWLMLLFNLAMVLFCIKRYAAKNFYILSCTILGSIVFVVLFEGRSRYLMTNLGFYIIMASLGMEKIIAFIRSYLQKLKRRRT